MKTHSCALALSCLSALLFTGAAMAQVDLSGNWVNESSQDNLHNGPGPFPDDFAGIPVNRSASLLGFAYNGEERQELNRQCEPWSVNYWVLGPWAGRFTAIHGHNGNVIGWHVGTQAYDLLAMTIWTDGRPHPPPQALHTYDGFTTGQWEGNTLHTTSTHLKDSYLERNGLPLSNQAVTDLFFTRHGEEMMLTGVVTDPVYLEAPWVRSRTLRLNTAGDASDPLLYCLPAETEALSDGYHTAVTPPPEQAQQMTYLKSHYNLPRLATDGGAQTMYPEFVKKIEGDYQPVSTYCKLYCCMPARGRQVVCETAE